MWWIWPLAGAIGIGFGVWMAARWDRRVARARVNLDLQGKQRVGL